MRPEVTEILNLQEAFLASIENINRSEHKQIYQMFLLSVIFLFRLMSSKCLQENIRQWETDLKHIDNNYEKNRKRTQQVLNKKKESINKFKQKLHDTRDESDLELNKLLSSMMRDFDNRNEAALQEDKIFCEDISNHEQRYYLLVFDWLQPLMTELCALLTQLQETNDFSKHVNDIRKLDKHAIKSKISSSGSDPEMCGKVHQSVKDDNLNISTKTTKCNTPVLNEGEEFERSQSPYSVALSPKLISKITKRPPLPCQRPKNQQSIVSTPSKSDEKDLFTNDPIISRNETKCFNINEVQGKFAAPGFLKFPELKESEMARQIVFSCENKEENNIRTKVQNFDASQRGKSNVSETRTSLPYPVIVPPHRQAAIKPYYSEISEAHIRSMTPQCVSTKTSSIPNKKLGETSHQSASNISRDSRPMTPPLKSIADQTAKAALIRTLITERLNSCSPVNFNA